jgi:hypothetical protein
MTCGRVRVKPVRRKNAYGAGKPTPVGLSATEKA